MDAIRRTTTRGLGGVVLMGVTLLSVLGTRGTAHAASSATAHFVPYHGYTIRPVALKSLTDRDAPVLKQLPTHSGLLVLGLAGQWDLGFTRGYVPALDIKKG